MRPLIRQPLLPSVPGSPVAAASDRKSCVVPLADNPNPYAAPQTIDYRAPRESFVPVIGLVLGLAVWLLFAVSLVLPGAAPVRGPFGKPATEAYEGFFCAWVYWPFYPSNLLMATLPLWLIATAIWPFSRWAMQLILWLLILSGCAALGLYSSLFRDIGYWLWVTSFFSAALAWLMISFAPRQRPTTFELTEHLRKS